MVNEKMKILKMLEEGRISAEEAARLLESTSASGEGPAPKASEGYAAPPPHPGTGGYTTTGSSGPHGGYSTSNNGRRPSDSSYAGRDTAHGGAPRYAESVADDLAKRFESFFKDFEPKLQRFTETVVEKTSNAADALAKSFSTPPPPRAPHPGPGPSQGARTAPSPSSAPSTAGRGRSERSFELKVSGGGNELIMEGYNGPVQLKGYNGDKISARVTYTARRGSPAMELMTLGSKYYLNYDENEFEMVSVDAYIPETLFNDIRVATNGGALVVSTVRAQNIKLQNSNGEVEIAGISAKDLLAETNNGGMKISGVRAERAVIDDFNGGISASDIDVSQLKMSTFNGGITMNVSGFNGYNEYMWAVESNNGKVNMVLPSSPDIGYHVRANAALSDVKIGLTGLSYIKNTKSQAEAQSVSFDQAARKVSMFVETSNAPLVIN